LVNKKIILSVLIIGCLATVAGAGTWAYFDDTKTSNNNAIETGTLKLSVDGSDASSTTFDTFSFTNLAPGDKDDNAKTFTVKNTGSLNGHLYADVSVVGSVPQHLKVTLRIPKNNGKDENYIDSDISTGKTDIDLGELDSGNTYNAVIGYDFTNDKNEQNIEQGQNLKYTITYHLKQITK
jgi:spore coat-associated protein N